MVLPLSGTITIDDILVELGKSPGTQASLNDSDFRALAGIPSGAITLTDFYGKSSGSTLVLPDLDLGHYGWDSQYDPPPDFRFHQNGSFEFVKALGGMPVGVPDSPVPWLSSPIELGTPIYMRLRADKNLNWSKVRYKTSTGSAIDIFIPRDVWTEIPFYPYTSDYIQVYASGYPVDYDGLYQDLDISLDGGTTFSTIHYRNWYE